MKMIVKLLALFVSLSAQAEVTEKVCLTGTTVKLFPKYGEAFYNGAKLAIDSSASNIVLKKYYYDRTPLAAVDTYKKMANDGCRFVIGFSTGNDLVAINNIVQKLKIPVFSIYGDNSKIVKRNQYIRTLQPSEDYLLRPLFSKLKADIKKIKKILVVTAIDREAMVNYKWAYQKKLNELNIETITVDMLEAKQNLKKIDKLIQRNFDFDALVLLTRSSLGAKIVNKLKQAKKLDGKIILGTKYFGSSALPAFLNYLDDKKVKAYFSRHNCLCDKDLKYTRFISAYRKKYKKEPMVISSSSFDLLNYYIKSMSKKGDSVFDKLDSTSYQGVSGVNILKNGKVEFTKSFQIRVSEDGYIKI